MRTTASVCLPNLGLGDARVKVADVERSGSKGSRSTSSGGSRSSSSSSHVFGFFVLWFGESCLFWYGSGETCSTKHVKTHFPEYFASLSEIARKKNSRYEFDLTWSLQIICQSTLHRYAGDVPITHIPNIPAFCVFLFDEHEWGLLFEHGCPLQSVQELYTISTTPAAEIVNFPRLFGSAAVTEPVIRVGP